MGHRYAEPSGVQWMQEHASLSQGATSVCCALCRTITSVPPPGVETAHLICGGCRTLLMYPHGAATVRCSCCNMINNVRSANSVAHVNCAQCRTTLMYPYGAPSVKCAVCHYVTNTGMTNMMAPASVPQRPNEYPSTSAPPSQGNNVTVVVENPKSVDERGNLVNNVVVGVTVGKK
uniref:Zinc finger LSD1-type domain-containing protein n=1 Tax=Ananas comosus var. bracteatus TaxID=296719 RepID=A0A6V7NLX7_ANACO|nr:unnamed protein product [Ananas comosus var. bracteatus]